MSQGRMLWQSEEKRDYKNSELSWTQHWELSVGGEDSSDSQRIAIVALSTKEWGSIPGRGSGVS